MRPAVYVGIRDGIVGPLFRLLYRVRVDGRVPERGPAILTANHVSVVDPLALALATRRPVRFFAKDELYDRRWLVPLLRALGGIRVRKGRRVLEAVAEGEALLRRGEVLGVFPEGRISREDGRWQHGAARLALETAAPIVPVRLVGTADALRRGHVGLPRVQIVVGEPIRVEPARPTARLEERLMREVAQAVRSLA